MGVGGVQMDVQIRGNLACTHVNLCLKTFKYSIKYKKNLMQYLRGPLGVANAFFHGKYLLICSSFCVS